MWSTAAYDRVQVEYAVHLNFKAYVDVPDNGCVAEIAAFVEAILKGKPSPVPGEQALITQRVLDGIYASGKAGKEVEV